MSDTVQLIVDGKTFTYPVITGTEGERGIDIAELRSGTGLITLDPGFGNTGSCQRHHLHRRREGNPPLSRHPHRTTRQQPDFIETAWLLICGRLPKPTNSALPRRLTQHASSMKPSSTTLKASRQCPAHGDALGDDQHRWPAFMPRNLQHEG